ncbi:AMP-binding protein [Streptomyces spongiae]|uniref:AMP-binding protein n=1 Tax=Streptomyces spongiae TaxID=565072 RepID=UPI00188365C3|nr:AMP-binding protein [Streptomyces spongiae]
MSTRHTHLTELRAAVEDAGDEAFVVMDDVTHTYADVGRAVDRLASGLLRLGLTAGDRVLLMLPNSIEALWAWWAVDRLGAIDVPVSVEAVGSSLRHVLLETRPRVVIVTADLVSRIADVMQRASDAPEIDLVVVVGDDFGAPRLGTAQVTTISAVMDAQDGAIELPTLLARSTTATVMFSSGTTGPPKGVMLSHGYYGHAMHAYDEVLELGQGQRIYCTQPLCHIDPRLVLVQAMASRATAILTRRFSASAYWADVERYDVHAFVYIGAMLHLINKQPRGASSSRRRIGMGSAIPPSIHRAFCERFDVDLLEGYGMTEMYTILCQYPGEHGPGDVGRELPGTTIRIVDGEDELVDDGVPGQLLVRPDDPSAIMQGYWNQPEATVAAWQGLWFRTGDVVRRLANGRIQYVGRVKDSIRRRGENVSAWEVETAVNRLDEVLESAAIGIPADVGDEDIALFVVARPGMVLDPAKMRDAIARDLPRFALPRYIEVVDSLPKTSSERVAKATLRERGLSARALDFDTAPGRGRR